MGDFDVPISDKAMEDFWSLSNLAMPENSKKAADNEKVFGALLTNLSKAFDCNDHKILIARLSSTGFHLQLLIWFTRT